MTRIDLLKMEIIENMIQRNQHEFDMEKAHITTSQLHAYWETSTKISIWTLDHVCGICVNTHSKANTYFVPSR